MASLGGERVTGEKREALHGVSEVKGRLEGQEIKKKGYNILVWRRVDHINVDRELVVNEQESWNTEEGSRGRGDGRGTRV